MELLLGEVAVPRNITLRTQLLGGVAEFCAESNLSLLRETLTLVELIVALARYKEEGVNLRPAVYISDDMNSLMAMLPDGERMKLGETTRNALGIKAALKKAAPLAKDLWSIYLSDEEPMQYGIFRGSSNPLAVSTDVVILTESAPLKIVKVCCVAEECVEVQSNSGHLHRIFLDHRAEDSPPPLAYLEALAVSIVSKVPAEEREEIRTFLTKLLAKSLRDSHGCMVAVTDMHVAPKFLSNDGVILESPIDFPAIVTGVRRKAVDTATLDSRGSLLEGMLSSDGITLFDSKARLIGFNCFIKTSVTRSIVGGARRRAFSALTDKLGKGISAAFMQSQDGWTDFRSTKQ